MKLQPPRVSNKVLDIGLPLASILVFSLFFFPNAGFVGLYPDEAMVGRVAWAFLRRLPQLMEGPVSIRLFGLYFPLNADYSHGPGEFYSTVPFVWLFGPTAQAIHWRSALCAFAAIAAMYRLGWVLYRDRWAAFFGCALLAASPSLTCMSFYGVEFGALEVAAGLAGLCLLLHYAEHRRPAFAYWGCASLGFALSSRSTMFAFVIGLGIFAGLFRKEVLGLLPARPKERARFIAVCAGVIMLFCAPLLTAYLVGGLWPRLRAHLLVQETGARNFGDYGDNLLVRFKQLRRILTDMPYAWKFKMADFPHSPSSQLLMIGAVLSGTFLALRAAVLRKPGASRWMLPCVIGSVYLLLSPFCPTSLQPCHLFPILPLAYLTASSLVAMPRRPAARIPLILAFLLFTGYRVCSSAALFRDFHAQASRTRVFAVAEDLSDWLIVHPGYRPVFLGWGGEHFRYFSMGKPAGYLDAAEPSFERQADELLKTDGNLFVFSAESTGEMPALFALLGERARRSGKALARVDSILRPDGTLAFDLYRPGPITGTEVSGR